MRRLSTALISDNAAAVLLAVGYLGVCAHLCLFQAHLLWITLRIATTAIGADKVAKVGAARGVSPRKSREEGDPPVRPPRGPSFPGFAEEA